MRVIFFGTAEFAVPSLEQVAAHHDIVTCVTQPDRPQGARTEAFALAGETGRPPA